MCSSSGAKKALNNTNQQANEEVKLTKTYSKTKLADGTTQTFCYSKDKKRVRDQNGFRHRAAGLCIKGLENPPVFSVSEELQILLVSGRADREYWVLPGGGVEEWENSEQAVIREFKEEAGVQAAIVAKIGEFTDNERCHRTNLYMLSAEIMFDEWEDFQRGRQRCWMGIEEALRKVKSSQVHMIEQSLIAANEILKNIKS